MSKLLTHIGEHTVSDFMAGFWQREAYLARQAIPGFQSLLSADEVLKLSTYEEVESRLIIKNDDGSWQVEYGPFTARTFKKLPATGWTILVQGLNIHHLEADALLRRFAFIPYARLDDLMVSYAVDGGGVGPHFDSYDVFLLQGLGERKWSISAQTDLSLVPDVPLKILQKFKPEQSWILQPGDMLYLPPQYAHDGVAVGECMTYSIGFRAPVDQEWAQGFLNFWHDQIALTGIYQDIGLKATDHPAHVPEAMQKHVQDVLKKMLWSQENIGHFIGCYLTEPKATLFFESPKRVMGLKRFKETVLKQGVILDQKTQLLYDQENLYCNGEAWPWEDYAMTLQEPLRRLANVRYLSKGEIAAQPEIIEAWLYEAYCSGFLHMAEGSIA